MHVLTCRGTVTGFTSQACGEDMTRLSLERVLRSRARGHVYAGSSNRDAVSDLGGTAATGLTLGRT